MAYRHYNVKAISRGVTRAATYVDAPSSEAAALRLAQGTLAPAKIEVTMLLNHTYYDVGTYAWDGVDVTLVGR